MDSKFMRSVIRRRQYMHPTSETAGCDQNGLIPRHEDSQRIDKNGHPLSVIKGWEWHPHRGRTPVLWI
ncbi:MAG: hypothetical protein ACK2UE_10615 [Anaerolineales bacterium]